MEVVVTAGAISHAKLQSNHYHQQTTTKSFLQAGCPSCRPTNRVKALKGKYHIQWTCLPIYLPHRTHYTSWLNIQHLEDCIKMLCSLKIFNALMLMIQQQNGYPASKESYSRVQTCEGLDHVSYKKQAEARVHKF